MHDHPPAVLAPEATAPAQRSYASAQYFLQQQDHHDASSHRTWRQAYYVNDTFWSGAASGAPVFLCIGGEGQRLSGKSVAWSRRCSLVVEALQQHGALMLALEHRFYGCWDPRACPFLPFKEAPPLRLLSAEQALADMATFHSHATERFGLTPANRWVAFGASYPGMLASWMRQRYPHLIHAAVASSAPVRAVAAFGEYNDVVAAAYESAAIGGSPRCAEALRVGHEEVRRRLGTAAGRGQLFALFPHQLPTAAWLERRAHQLEFCGAGVIDFPVQAFAHEERCDGAACNVRAVCAALAPRWDGSPPHALRLLAELAAAVHAESTAPTERRPSVTWRRELAYHPRRSAYDAALAELDAPALVETEGLARAALSGLSGGGGGGGGGGAGGAQPSPAEQQQQGQGQGQATATQTTTQTTTTTQAPPPPPPPKMAAWAPPLSAADWWPWAMCSQFGFFATCEEGSRCLWARGVATLDATSAVCRERYGVSTEQLRRNVAATNARYGGDAPNASRVLYVNAEVDGYHAASVLLTPPGRPELPTLWVAGGSHHAWTYPTLPTDSDAVVQARERIWAQVQAWLHDVAPPEDELGERGGGGGDG